MSHTKTRHNTIFKFLSRIVMSACVFSGLFVSRLPIYGEATCCFPEESSKKSRRKPWYFRVSDAAEIGMVVVWRSFRLDKILPSSVKCASSSITVVIVKQAGAQNKHSHIVCMFSRRDW